MIPLQLITSSILVGLFSVSAQAQQKESDAEPGDLSLMLQVGQYEPRDGLLRSLYQENPRLYSLSFLKKFQNSRLGYHVDMSALSFNSAVSNLESYTNLYMLNTGLRRVLSSASDPLGMFIEAGLGVIYLDVVIEDEQLELKVQGERSWTWGSYYRFGTSYQLTTSSEVEISIAEQNVFGKIYGNVNLSGHTLQLGFRYYL